MKTKKGTTLLTPAQQAEADKKILDDFNSANPVGKTVWYWSTIPFGPVRETVIREPAWFLPSGDPVCMVRNVSGAVSIWHISDVEESRRSQIQFVDGDVELRTEPPPWPISSDPCGSLDQHIDEDWLRDSGFRIESGRNDDREPLRRLRIAWHGVDGKQFMESPDDLCIDIAPYLDSWSTSVNSWTRWHCWIMQIEPYRHIHVRPVRYRWELIKLYEGLTGRCWPGRY